MNIETVWSDLETTIKEMESGRGDWNNHVATARAGIELLFEYPSEQIVEHIRKSGWPVRGVVKWLVHEAGQFGGVDPARLEELNRLLLNMD